MDEHQIELFEAVIGTLLIVSFMSSIFEMMTNAGVTLSAVLSTNSIYDILMRYVALALLAYMYVSTKKIIYLPFIAIWPVWILSTLLIVLPPMAYSILGFVCFMLGFIYLMKVIE